VPASVLYGIADVLAMTTYLTCRAQVGTLCANLARLLPEASGAARARLARKIFRNYARYLVDYGRFRWMPREGLEAAIADLDGGQNLQAAFAMDRGVILVTGHVGNWELGGVFFGHRGVKVHVVTLPDGSRQIDAIREMYREEHAVNTIVLDGSPFAPGDEGGSEAAEVQAMPRQWEAIGVPAFRRAMRPDLCSTATGLILPAFVVCDGTTGIVELPIAVGTTTAPYAARVSEALERVIRRCPDQWYNFVAV
jgi:KDO2-lipid IV(A) lauroyltransferase